jgi:hypothetical protein
MSMTKKKENYKIIIIARCKPIFSTTVGTPHVAFAMGTKYHTTSRQFSMYDAGFCITKPNCDVSITL